MSLVTQKKMICFSQKGWQSWASTSSPYVRYQNCCMATVGSHWNNVSHKYILTQTFNICWKGYVLPFLQRKTFGDIFVAELVTDYFVTWAIDVLCPDFAFIKQEFLSTKGMWLFLPFVTKAFTHHNSMTNKKRWKWTSHLFSFFVTAVTSSFVCTTTMIKTSQRQKQIGILLMKLFKKNKTTSAEAIPWSVLGTTPEPSSSLLLCN